MHRIFPSNRMVHGVVDAELFRLFSFELLLLLLSVCVFSSHLFWRSSSLDVPAGVTQEEGHTGFFSYPPSFCGACLNFSRERRIQPFLSLVDREVEFLCLKKNQNAPKTF